MAKTIGGVDPKHIEDTGAVMSFKMLNREKASKTSNAKANRARPWTPTTSRQQDLQVGARNHASEREADAMADAAMNGTQVNTLRLSTRGSSAQSGGTRSTSHVGPVDAGIAVARSRGGTVLPTEVRSNMESAYGQDFSHIRVHADNRAHALSRALNAEAFSVGRDIFFDRGKFQPQSWAGQHLLAHELAHTLQAPVAGEVIRRYPYKHMILNDDGSMRSYDSIAQAIIDKLEENPEASGFVTAILGAPLSLGLPDTWKQEQAIAEAFFTNLPPLLLARLRTSVNGAAAYRMLAKKLVSTEEYKAKIDKFYGIVPSDKQQLLIKPDFADTNETCMDLVLHNLDVILGKDAKDQITSLATKTRNEAIQKAEEELKRTQASGSREKIQRGEKKLEIAKRVLNSQNLNAAVTLGYATRIGKSVLNKKNSAQTMLKFDPANDANDPFNIQDGQHAKLLTPHPVQMLLDALADSPPGHYMFPSSVAGHHSITLFVNKISEGHLTAGGSGYEVFWNDQFNDESTTSLGRKFASDDEFIKKIFDLTAIERSDPNETSFWWGDPERQQKDLEEFQQESSNTKSAIVKRAVLLRFRNIVGIEIWHLQG